jgi:phosphatidylinositol-3-phosphatase
MPGRRVAIAIAGVALAAASVGGYAAAAELSEQPSQPPRFQHVILIVFENHDPSQVYGDPEAKTFRELSERYATLANYDAVAHPSLPNYLALVSGSTFGLITDCTFCVVDGPNLADTLAAHSLTWKAYVERLPRDPEALHLPAVKARIPFLYFEDVHSSPRRLRHIVSLETFGRDLRAGRLPSFSLVIPDLCHDMHDCSVSAGDHWLASFMRPLLASPELRRSVVFITFDEAPRPEDQGGGGQVPALVVGPVVRPSSATADALNHYSLLRTIEDGWRLPRLGLSRSAEPITGIWR